MTPNEQRFNEARVQRLIEYLPNLLFPAEVPFEIEYAPSEDPVPFSQLASLSFSPIHEGDRWGRDWSSAWFRLRARTPREWAGKTVVAHLNFTGEACVFSEEGEPLQGLTAGSIFNISFVRDRFPLFSPCKGGEEVLLLVEAAANDLFGLRRDQHPIPGKPYHEGFEARIQIARLAVFDEDIFHLLLDMALLDRLMRDLPERDPQRAQILDRLSAATNAFRYDAPNPKELREILRPCLEARADDTRLVTRAVGHAHIDTAWLWPMRETIRKCARTFSSQLGLIERYPGYVFGASQAQLYQFVKNYYPGLYERIRKAVASGRWEVQGAMWVEADCNVPSGESLVRQVLYGKLFFQKEFGVEVRNLWLPDVFGYSAALPQILRKVGVEFFVTQKISWSQFNRFPYHTFIWRGIDGSTVLTHFPPEDNYNSTLEPQRLRYAANNFEERGFLPGFLTLFGVGDGGGGPKEEHIEFGLRQRDLAGCTRVSFGHAQEFLDELAKYADRLPEWNGELYLELHRGTLTTQAYNKKMNRWLELGLRAAEILWSCLPPAQYPAEELETHWKTVLTHQFHDIIPGSSIHKVYEDSRRAYEHIAERLHVLRQDAAARLESAAAESAKTASPTLVNTLSTPVRGAVYVDAGTLENLPDAERLQETADGAWALVDLPPLTAAPLDACSLDDPSAGSSGSDRTLENGLVRYEFDEEGRLVQILDKRSGRTFGLPEQPGNLLCLYQDWPHNWDAWEVDLTYEQQLIETARLTGRRVLAAGPVAAIIEFEWEIGDSRITQQARLAANSARLDFVTHVDWNECRKMLRVRFPVDVHASEATYEIQFGLLRRPTHRNTSWDLAKFEVCGHRFVDLSDLDGGVALLNDSKYGHKVHGNVLDLNLLRAPYYPDPLADRGPQEFTYSIFPHPGPVGLEVVAEAHALNQPPLLFPGRLEFTPPCCVDGRRGALLDTLKKAEERDAFVARLYEPLGHRVRCEVRLREDVTRVFEADILERPVRELPVRDGLVELTLRPFEIVTLLLQP